jgi:hypothetical protein
MARNRPVFHFVPFFGPDSYSRDVSGANQRFSNPISPASVGPGITRTEQHTQAYFLPCQNFRGLTTAITHPSVPNFPATASFPSSVSTADPVLLAMSAGQIAGGI